MLRKILKSKKPAIFQAGRQGMEIDFSEKDEKNKGERSAQFYLRCTPEQKDFFQKVIAGSGRNGAELFSEAIENMQVKESDDPNLIKELAEADRLLDRLGKLIRSEIYLVAEAKRQTQSEHEQFLKEKIELTEGSPEARANLLQRLQTMEQAQNFPEQ